ncbi:MAG TPA: transporter substrate-binding protein [Gemmataceae bacterium]|nr:transporter substrate-binding protein [Gemmataceae bacterium]
MTREDRQCDPYATAADHTMNPADTANVGMEPAGDEDARIDLASVLSPPTSHSELGWLGHYRILKILGHGGMGLVLMAEDTHLLRKVALKIILPEYAGYQEARERFLREARVCAAIKNDHVMTVYQVGQHNDIPFLAMELLQGETLQSRLDRYEPMPIAETLRIGSEIADGLSAAHAQGLIHRDIKPANIWLEAPTGRVKLLDFGLARPTGGSQGITQAGCIVGTPEFMSPEQANGEEVDPRSDLFSFGAVLYTMCTGLKPFAGSNAVAILKAVFAAEPKPLGELAPEAPPAFVDLVTRLMTKDRARRPQSAQAVRDALADIARADQAATATPEPQRKRRWARRSAVGLLLASIVMAGLTALAILWQPPGPQAAPAPSGPSGPPIRIGVLHSRTGTMSVSERPVIDAVQLAVDELNARGLLGRPIEVAIADGQSEESVFASQAEKLIHEDKVCAIFGCWTSASRKAVSPVVERHNHLLLYPVQYEGMEQSPNIVYCGPVPNQQILPALRWMVNNEGRQRWFLVGSDYIFPAVANAIIRDEADARGCQILGEAYVPLGSLDVEHVVKQIAKAKPDLIVNTINGDTNVAFFRALRRAGLTAKETPTLSFSISEDELSQLPPGAIAGDYVAANYFQSLKLPKNQEFVARFTKRYGSERIISSAMETAYNAVHLWAKAVEAAGREEPAAVRRSIRDQQLDAAQGHIRVDPATLHVVQTARVGKLHADGVPQEVYCSPQPIVPQPFPTSRTRFDWEGVIDGLHKRWGGRWSNDEP